MSPLDSCVVRILGKTTDSHLTFLGTGVIVDKFHILTCWHVLLDISVRWKCAPHKVEILIQVNSDDSLILANIHNYSDQCDLLLLAVETSLSPSHKVVFLCDVVKPLKPDLLSAEYWLHGYDNQSAGKDLVHWSIPPVMPGFFALSAKLRDLQFFGGVPEGSSGSPIFISVGDQSFCIGIARLGSERSPTSKIVASDPVLAFLEASGIESLRTEEGHTALTSPLLARRPPSASAPTEQPQRLPLFLAGGGLSALLLALMVLFVAWPGGRSRLRRVFLPPFGHASPASTSQQILGACDINLKRQVFHNQDSFKILALRFGGAGDVNSPVNQQGYATGRWVWEQMQRYQRNQTNTAVWQTSGLGDKALEIEFEPCMAENHRAARAIGQARGADVVLWGSIVLPQPNDSQTAKVRSFVTAIRRLSASVESPHRIAVPELEQLEFPQIATRQPLALIEFLLGVFALERQRFDVASSYFTGSMKQVQVSGGEQGQLQEWVGRSYVMSGHAAEGLALLQERRDRCQPTDKRCRTQSLSSFVWALDHLGRHAEAAQAAQELLALSKETGELQHQVCAHTAVSSQAFLEGHHEEAIQQGQFAIQLALESGDAQAIGCAINNFSVYLYKSGKPTEAIENMEQVLILLNGHNFLNEEAITLGNIGKIYSDQGNNKAAIPFFSKAFEKSVMSGDKEHQASLLGFLGESYLSTNQPDEAVKHLEKAIRLWNELSIISNGTLLMEKLLGDALQQRGDITEALMQYQQLLPRVQKQKIPSPYAEAGLYRAIGDASMKTKPIPHPQDAINAYRQAFRVLPKGDKQMHPDLLSNSARAYLTAGNHSTGIQQLVQAAKYLHLRAEHKDDERASSEIQTACDISELTNNHSAYQRIIAELPQVGLDEVFNISIRARYYSWNNQSNNAQNEYQHIIALTRNSSKPAARMRRIMALAGLERQKQGGQIQGCRGVVITSLHEDCKDTPGKFRVGDIILRVENNDTCINTNLDFSSQIPLLQKNRLLIWRNEQLQVVNATNRFAFMPF